MGRRRVVGTISSRKLSSNNSSDTISSESHKTLLDDDIDIFLKGDSEILVEKIKDANGDDVIILKSDSDIIDIPLPVVRKKLTSLFEVKDVNLTELSKKHKDELQNITSIMSGLYNTNCYDEIIFQINDIFSKGGSNIKPGTVYSYFYGCKMRSDFSPFSCSPICAGSIQPTDMGNGWSVCNKFAILYDCEKGKFSLLNNPSNKEDAYIFIPVDCKFTGFNSQEIKSLEKLGIRNVMIISYDKNNASKTSHVDEVFRPIIEVSIDGLEAVPKQQVQQTVEKVENVVNQQNSSTGNIIFWVFLIIIILLIIGVLIYLIVVYSGKKTSGVQKREERIGETKKSTKSKKKTSDIYSELGRGNSITEALL